MPMSHSFAASSIGQRIVTDATLMMETRNQTTGEIDSGLDVLLKGSISSAANVGEMLLVCIARALAALSTMYYVLKVFG